MAMLSCNWRWGAILCFAAVMMLWGCCQILLLGSGGQVERERAMRAEDLLLHSQSQWGLEKRALEQQVAGLQQQLRASSKVAAAQDLQALVKSQQTELKELREETARLKLVSPAQVLAQRSLAASAGTGKGPITEDTLRRLAASGAIGVAVITCKRPQYLSRAMDSFLHAQRNPEKFPIVISQDGHDAAMTQLVQSKFVATGQAYHMHHDHDPNANSIAKRFGGSKMALGYVYIAQHFGFVMRRMFDDFDFQSVIFLEEDLEVSRDFFSYFGTMEPLLRNDPDLFCVSAWNDLGYQTHVQDPKAAYRTDFFPGLGWMMDKAMWGEVRDRWAVAYWDEFMRRKDVRKGRHCIRPEISRSFTFGEEGVSVGQFFKQHLAKIKLNDVDVDWKDQDNRMLASAEAFDNYLRERLRAATPVSLSDIEQYSGKSETLRIEYDDAHYKATVAKKFGLMEDEKEGIRRMSYRGVIPFRWQTNLIYIHTGSWPGPAALAKSI